MPEEQTLPRENSTQTGIHSEYMADNSINIFGTADIYNCTSCYHDSKSGYITTWPTDNDLGDYTVVGGLTSVTSWGGVYFAVSSSEECYVSQGSDVSIDASYYQIIKVKFRLDPDHHIERPATGKIQFQTSSEMSWSADKSVDFDIQADNEYHEYRIDMSTHLKWGGTISRFRLYFMTDGVPGIRVHLRHIKVESRDVFFCDSHLSGDICDKAYAFSHPCPWAGSPGKSVSQQIFDTVNIVQEENDKLLVNIDGYGYQSVTLRPTTNASLGEVARDIQEKLNLIGVGGYAFARCYVSDYRLVIESDWPSTESAVVVAEPAIFSAGKELKFFDSQGAKIATETAGVSPASRYERAPMQLSSSAIMYMKSAQSSNNEGAFVIDGYSYSPQGGLPEYDNFSREQKLSFRNKTLIDYNNPINFNGIITFVGYSGDGLNNTEFRIYRQLLDGSYVLVGSVDMSYPVSEQLDMVFEKEANIHVKKGDLLGLYSASVHLGSSRQTFNGSYILYDGDLTTGTRVQKLTGNGDGGLPLFVRGDRRSNEAVLNIDFDGAKLVESVLVRAQEEETVEEVNLCTVRNGGLGGGPHVTGETGYDVHGNKAPDMVNLEALIDGLKRDKNGSSDLCYPGWALYDQVTRLDFDYTNFNVVFDFAKGIDVYFPIYKINAYFSSVTNIKDFRWEVPISTDPTDTYRIWGCGWSRYSAVYTETGLQDSNHIYVYDNPAVLTSENYEVSYKQLGYRCLKSELAPFRARSLRYNVTLGDSPVTDTSDPAYSYFPVAPSPYIEEIEVFAKFTPNRNITDCFYFESSTNGDSYLTHDDVDDVSDIEAKYVIGRPVQSMILHISTDTVLSIKSISCVLTEEDMEIESNNPECVAINAPVANSESFPQAFYITNNSDDTCNFVIDLYDEGSKKERCLLWNRMYSDDYLAKSEIGPGGIIRRREYQALRPYNYAYKCPGYYLDKNFLFNRPAYISYDNKLSWTTVGTTITDSSDSTYLTNESVLFHIYDYVYVALDMGDNYAVDSVSLFSPDELPGFSSTVLYSKMNTDNPGDIPADPDDPDAWGVAHKSQARWLLFMSPAINFGGPGTKRYLSRVETMVDFLNPYNKGKIPWKSANGMLTNGISGYWTSGQEEGWISNGQAQYYCVDLLWLHSVTDVITGPFSDAAYNIVDIDATEPGYWPSIVSSECAGEDVAFSSSFTSDPADVVWGSFGDPPSGQVRWVMVKVDDTRVEEIIVHTNDNDRNSKQSFLNSNWFSSSSVPIYSEYAHTKSGICAAAMDYPADHGEEEYFLLKQSFGYDVELSRRDALCFWLYIEDVSQIDKTYGYFRLGKSITQANNPLDINLEPDDYNYYEWSFSDVSSTLENGWNYVMLPFSDNNKYGEIYFVENIRGNVGSVPKRERITYFKYLFKGVADNSAITIRIDDFKVLRRYFSTSKFEYGAYIPNNEYVKFPLNDFDPMHGTIEFYLKSDWTRSFLCNNCGDTRDHTIFRVFSSEDSTLFSLYMTGDGLSLFVHDGSDTITLTDNNRYNIEKDVPTHVAVVWCFDDNYSAPGVAIYIDGNLSSSIDRGVFSSLGYIPSPKQRNLYTLILGGKGWQGHISEEASSVDGVIENLKVYNYPLTNFANSQDNYTPVYTKRSLEFVELSLDGINFYGVEDRGNGFPLIKKSVSAGERFAVQVRSRDLDKYKLGDHNRRAYIALTRTPA